MAASNGANADFTDENLRDDVLPGKKFLVRVVLNRQVATETVEMDGASSVRIDSFLANLSNKIPLYDCSEFDAPGFWFRELPGRTLTKPLLLLQETATSGRHEIQHRLWTVVPPDHNQEYAHWVTQNLRASDTDVLRIEAHFFISRTNVSAYDERDEHERFEREVKRAATGSNKLDNAPLVQIKSTDILKPLSEWLPSFQRETTPAHPGRLVYAPTTTQFFPQRYIEDPLAYQPVCSACRRLAVERGLVKPGRRQKARANRMASQAAQAGELGVSRETSVRPVAGSNSGGQPDMDADERLARQLQAEEHGLRRRAGVRHYKGLD
ncbi:hypothetical protein PV04_03193 [Phialophora macrospora]|uniref:Uncharacterized protein n=1 Tax=Phialophora macrospora TaxID=1851006 RepID=A0A0D2D0J7_9EURO|nr:hypothetical protein PV04_03193 [Phialophora macrospora]